MRVLLFCEILLLVFAVITGAITTGPDSSIGELKPIARCGTEAIDSNFKQSLKTVKAYENTIKLKARDSTHTSKRGSLPGLDVAVHFHTVSSAEKADAITDDALKAQFAVLKETYTKYDINLHWNGTVASRTVDDWLSQFSWPLTRNQVVQKKEFLTSTRLGGYNALNFYFYTGMADEFWGSCNLPKVNVTVDFEDSVFREDGCNINHLAMPGGPSPAVNLGYTAIHETGHWFGLQHVFLTYMCDETGDTIDDTPAASEFTVGCPIGKDSCPDMPGLDPIHNFMDYSDDYCMTEFTPDQKIRMHATYATLRSNLTALPSKRRR
ncbi:hypothetical protein IFR05_009604 [Cadophora sp. M221]|nr:hypothetical protein IFR05_009604 [Cadophora sp. M221]